EDGIRDRNVTGVQTCALPIWTREEEFAWSPSRPEAVLEIAAGLGADGRIVSWRYVEHTNVHTAAGLDPGVLGVTSGRNALSPYRSEERRVGKGCRSRWARGVY